MPLTTIIIMVDGLDPEYLESLLYAHPPATG